MFKRWITFWAALILTAAFPAQHALAEAIYLPSLGSNATGTNVTGKLGLDVNVISPISVTQPADGATGSPVPTYAGYTGANQGGNLVGLLVGQQTMANSLACVLPSNQSAIPVNQGTANATPWNQNVAQFGGSAVATGTGGSGAGIPRVTVSSDSAITQGAAAALAGAWPAKITDGTNAASVTASSALKVDGSAVTQPISAASLPLPTGASTAAKQPALGTAGAASTDVITVQGIASMTALKVDGSAVTQPVSGTFWQATQPVSAASLPLPTGASTAAKQPALGTAGTPSSDVITVQGAASMTALKVDGSAVTQPVSFTSKAPVNTTGSGSAAAATVSTVITLTAPANAVGFVLQNLDTSTANLRWSIGRTATTTLGQQLQPGRDTGFIPAGANVSLVAESGTQNYDVQWVSQ
jgi:hypothetical protein